MKSFYTGLVAAPICQRVLEAFVSQDLAAAADQQALAVEMIAVLNRYGGQVAGKAVMKMLGLDCGPVRPPPCAIYPRNNSKRSIRNCSRSESSRTCGLVSASL